MKNLPAIQEALRAEGLGGWLVYDFRGSSSTLSILLPGRRWTTRRVLLFIPPSGAPQLVVNPLDAGQFSQCGVELCRYTGWREYNETLERLLSGAGRIAMEYSPGCALPVVSSVDAGTIEAVRALGVEVSSSANLIQRTLATWSDEAVAGHATASRLVAAAKDSAFDLIRARLASGTPINEYEVQQHILDCFRTHGLQWPDPPIVGVNSHSGDPHFEVSPTDSSPIRKGDWVLIDLWARLPGDENIFSDITWVGFAGASPSRDHRMVFETVKAARNAALRMAQDSWRTSQPVEGWQLDEAASLEIQTRGFGDYIKHRTGHSLSPGPKVHGVGMNLDNLETHDTRRMIPGIGFTIEPGIYRKDFGVRLEINVFVSPGRGPEVTSCLQEEIVTLATP